jgi:hypothetical protein
MLGRTKLDMFMDLYSNFLFKNITIELSSYGNQGNIICTKFKFVGTLQCFHAFHIVDTLVVGIFV